MSDPSSPSPGTASAGPLRAGVKPFRWLVLLTIVLAVSTLGLWLKNRSSQQRVDSGEHLFWVLCQPGFTQAQRESAFRQLAAQGNREWRSAQLFGLDFHGIDLARAELTGAGFQKVNFSHANLAGANLARSSLEMANLTAAILNEADLSEGQLYRTVLQETSLVRAKLRAALLQEAQAQKANFSEADLSDADCVMADFTDANLTGADLAGARLESAILKGANLSMARFNGAKLADVDLMDTNWWRARGLTSQQLDAFRKKFAPTQNSPGMLQEDYAKWNSQSGE